MSYKVYIKKNYKPEVAWVDERKLRSNPIFLAVLSALAIAFLIYFAGKYNISGEITNFSAPRPEVVRPVEELDLVRGFIYKELANEGYIEPLPTVYYEHSIDMPLAVKAQKGIIKRMIAATVEGAAKGNRTTPGEETGEWQTVTVKNGDSMAHIFPRLGLSPGELHRVMSLGEEVASLEKIKPGQLLHFRIVEGKLLCLKYDLSLTNTLSVLLVDRRFKAELVEHELDTVIKNASAVINDSLFMAGKKAGLSDKLIMQMARIYGWSIDFALDIRQGDSFTLMYEEKYRHGQKVADGPILAAAFNNRGQEIRAVSYTHTDGSVDYYDAKGNAMRKAFLRTPVNFTRISSRFNLKRKHPILNKIRAHKGVDYAAPTGTPVKAVGDGTVVHVGIDGGYGKTIILKHGGNYSTVYAHLHKYVDGIRTGKRVKQGQVIGYVGMSGLATGPHLHYEFRINGVHRNPLAIELPHAESISENELPTFQQKILPLLVRLDQLNEKFILAPQHSLLTENTAAPVLNDDG